MGTLFFFSSITMGTRKRSGTVIKEGEWILAKGKKDDWLTADGLLLIEGWARSGLTDEQIAENMGINVRTLYRWKNEEERICQSLKKSKEIADFRVENALYESALGGNVTAMIFWLKNRKPDMWREKVSADAAVKFEDDGFVEAMKETAKKVFEEHPGEVDE